MENKTIVSIDKRTKDYHSCDRHEVIITGVLKENIELNFISRNRTDTAYVITYNSDTYEFIAKECFKYGAAGNMYKDVLKDLKSLFNDLSITLPNEDINKLGDIICKCVSKCESRFGMSVTDFDIYNADALIIIKGEDNGKPKYKVTLIDEFWDGIDLKDDFPLPDEFKGRCLIENKKVTWLIEKESSNFEDIIKYLITEFENPYLILTPDMDVILDFRLEIKKY